MCRLLILALALLTALATGATAAHRRHAAPPAAVATNWASGGTPAAQPRTAPRERPVPAANWATPRRG